MKSQGFQSYERSVFCSVPALRHCRCTMAPSAGLTVIKLTDVPTWEACGFLMLFETLKQSDTWFRALSIVWRACKLLEARSHGKSVSSFRGTGTYDILWQEFTSSQFWCAFRLWPLQRIFLPSPGLCQGAGVGHWTLDDTGALNTAPFELWISESEFRFQNLKFIGQLTHCNLEDLVRLLWYFLIISAPTCVW